MQLQGSHAFAQLSALNCCLTQKHATSLMCLMWMIFSCQNINLALIR